MHFLCFLLQTIFINTRGDKEQNHRIDNLKVVVFNKEKMNNVVSPWESMLWFMSKEIKKNKVSWNHILLHHLWITAAVRTSVKWQWHQTGVAVESSLTQKTEWTRQQPVSSCSPSLGSWSISWKSTRSVEQGIVFFTPSVWCSVCVFGQRQK